MLYKQNAPNKEKLMRRHLSLPVIFLVLFMVGTVAAQESLVENKDKNDPCNRFKMRILMPVDKADHRLATKWIEDGIDYKMVWNPCPRIEPQFAFVPLQRAPGWTFRFQSPMTNSGPKNRSEFQFAESPAAFKFKWRSGH
jgi:hypothetical protein